MNRKNMSSIITGLYDTIKSSEDLVEIRGVLNSIARNLKKPNSYNFSVGDNVITDSKLIMNGEIVEILDEDKAKVKEDKYVYVLPLGMLRIKGEK